MKTTATNKKLRVILTAIQNKTLVPNPDFQRRLVWSSKDKNAFLRTVLGEYPFPEIYVAAGDINPDTAEGTEMLVDGQQRVTTLYQYFKASDELRLENDIPTYSVLKEDPTRLRAFLEYEVVVRDLGQLGKTEIVEVFRRINSTKYSLNAVEVHNARFEGAFKAFAEDLAANEFFERHRIFSAATIRRMGDLRFMLTLVSTILSTYFNRDDGLEEFLAQYNDEFPHANNVLARLEQVFALIEGGDFGSQSRAWSEVNLLPLIVEVYRTAESKSGDAQGKDDTVAGVNRLRAFFDQLSADGERAPPDSPMGRYYAAQRYATADRGNRLQRGQVLSRVLRGMTADSWTKPTQETLFGPTSGS